MSLRLDLCNFDVIPWVRKHDKRGFEVSHSMIFPNRDLRDRSDADVVRVRNR